MQITVWVYFPLYTALIYNNLEKINSLRPSDAYMCQ